MLQISNDPSFDPLSPPGTTAAGKRARPYASNYIRSTRPFARFDSRGPKLGVPLRSTTKYTVLTFIPLNLFQQFGRVANFYFLLSAILSCIRVVSPLGSPFTAVRPPVIAVLVSCLASPLWSSSPAPFSHAGRSPHVRAVHVGDERGHRRPAATQTGRLLSRPSIGSGFKPFMAVLSYSFLFFSR